MATQLDTAAMLSGIGTLGELFAWRARTTPQREAYRQFEAASGKWGSTTWQQAAERIQEWCRAIGALNLPVGERIAILLPNGLNAVCADQSALALGLVPVPMHAIDNPASISYILNDSQARLLVVSTRGQWDAIAQVSDSLPHLKLVVLTGEGDAANTSTNSTTDSATHSNAGVPVVPVQHWLSSAAQTDGSTAPRRSVTGDDLAAIVYTSGTTGRPKGVMLTHHNILANVKAVLDSVPAKPDDVFLSFLPLSHTFERTIGYYLPVAAGCCVVYARSVPLLMEDLKIARPTVLVSVPRIYERVYAKLQEMLAAEGGIKPRIFALAQSIGWRRFCRRQGLPHNEQGNALMDAMLWPLLERLVARPLLAQFGGRLRLAVSGGAPMSQAVTQCFLGLGLPMVQGYGMTETSPVVAANSLDDNWPMTVGHVMQGVEVRLGENNELQVRGPSVMRGYWNRPEDTQRAMMEDGWLRTGDQAAIEEGRIRITGRIKEIMVTSTGEKIAPADLELAITSDPLFEQAMVLGENRPFISAVIVLNRQLWTELARSLGLNPDDAASLHAPAAREAALQKIRALTGHFPHYAVPRAVWMTLEPWTVQNGFMTPTLKLKRNPLQAHFAKEIAQLYERKAQVAA